MKSIFHFLAKKILLKSNNFKRLACSDLAARWMFNKSQNITILKNAIDLDKFTYNENARNKIRNQLRIDNKIVLGIVGNMSFQKIQNS